MTRNKELDIQRYTHQPNVWDLAIKDFRPGMQPSPTGDWVRFYDVESLVQQVEREVWEKVIASVKTQIDIYDSQVEGCDADEFALYNGMTTELSKFIQWLIAQQQELT